jgi:hypothetical protein
VAGKSTATRKPAADKTAAMRKPTARRAPAKPSTSTTAGLQARVQELEAALKRVEKGLTSTIKKTRGATRKRSRKLRRQVEKLVGDRGPEV